MSRTRKGGRKLPINFMKDMKKLKRKRMRQTSINEVIVEQKLNDAAWQL